MQITCYIFWQMMSHYLIDIQVALQAKYMQTKAEKKKTARIYVNECEQYGEKSSNANNL